MNDNYFGVIAARQKNKKIFVGLFTTLFLYFGWLVWRVLSFPASNLNVDTYYYISLASSSIYCNVIKLHDAFTVGIFIPKAVEYLSTVLSSLGILNIFFWQIFTTKIIVVFCFVVILSSCVYTKKNDSNYMYVRIALTSALFMSFIVVNTLSIWPELVRDGISLNGEIVCVAFISLQILILDTCKSSRWMYLLQSLIFVLVANTKIQAAPISMALILLTSNKKNISINIFWTLGLFSCVEIILYSQHAGFFYKLFDLIKYIQHGSGDKQEISKLLFLRFSNGMQTTLNSIRLFPAILCLTLLALHSRFSRHKLLENNVVFFIILLVVFICVNVPNRTFVHYSMLYWIPAVFFIRNYKCQKFTKVMWIPTMLLPIWLVITLTFWRPNEFSRVHSFHEAVSPYKENEMHEVATFLRENKLQRIYINSWNYSIYSYLEACLADDEYASLALGQTSYQLFYKNVFSGKYEAIIDLPGNGQIPVDKRYSLNMAKVQEFSADIKFCEKKFSDGVAIYFKCNRQPPYLNF